MRGRRARGASRRHRALAAVVLSCCGWLVAGCSSQLPPTHYYVLEVEPGAPGAVAGDPWAIGVERFAVDSPYDDERIVYRVGERSPEVGFYSYHVWASPLSAMLPAVAAGGLAGTAGVSVIEPVVAGRRYDAVLHGRVLAVEEVDLPDRQSVRASLLLRLVGPGGEELWAETIEARGDVTTGAVTNVVESLASALDRALDAAQPGLARALAAASR